MATKLKFATVTGGVFFQEGTSGPRVPAQPNMPITGKRLYTIELVPGGSQPHSEFTIVENLPGPNANWFQVIRGSRVNGAKLQVFLRARKRSSKQHPSSARRNGNGQVLLRVRGIKLLIK